MNNLNINPKAEKNRLIELLLYISLFTGLAFFVYWRGQDRNWDLLNYHFYQGYALLNGRFLVDIAAAGLQSFLNPIANLLAYLSLTYLPFPLSGWSILLLQLTSLPAIVLISKEVSSQIGYKKNIIPAIPAILLSLLAPVWGSELGTTFFSSWTAPLILWGVYFLLCTDQTSGFSKSRICVAGLFFGLSAGLKLTNAPFAVSGFLMLVILLYRNGWRVSTLASAFFLIACGAGFAITAWWNWYLWSVWGSPIFPLYNEIFRSEFFDFINFRDMRWYFSSLKDFFIFVVQSAWGTGKTSEIPFADARYLFLALLVPAAFLCRPAMKLNRNLMAFIAFMSSSFLLWVFMFAYQRYLIPFELLIGPLIWIIVTHIVASDWLRKSIMICLTIIAMLLIKIPDWGHAVVPIGGKNPFSIEMDTKISATPARYIVVGHPISYILPSFHPNSSFYGVGLSRQIDDLIFRKLQEPSSLPLRILSKDTDAILIPELLKRVRYSSIDHSLNCEYFKTGIGRYNLCEVYFQKLSLSEPEGAVAIDFSANGYMKFGGILWERGLSFMEPWGRWSDGSQIDFGLSKCLPQGRLKLIMVGHAFGPNVGVPINIVIGNKEIVLKFGQTDSQQTVLFSNEAKCIDNITIKIPRPISPQELGLSADARKLGLGLVSLKIIKE